MMLRLLVDVVVSSAVVRFRLNCV